MTTYRTSPFGMTTCCICDAPTTHTIPTDDKELLPYCASCAAMVKREFPKSKVYLYVNGATVEFLYGNDAQWDKTNEQLEREAVR